MRPKTDFVKKKYRKADSMPLILCLRRSAQCPRTAFAGRFSELTLRADSEALFAREHPLFSPIYSELFKIKRCSLIKFPVNFLSDGDGSFKIRSDDRIAVQCNHFSVITPDNKLSGLYAESCSENTVKCTRRTAALNMTQNDRAAFKILCVEPRSGSLRIVSSIMSERFFARFL